MIIDILDIAQRANNIMGRSEFERLEKAYENSYLDAVKFRNMYPRQMWTNLERSKYNDILIKFDIAKTDLMQFVSLRNASSEILY